MIRRNSAKKIARALSSCSIIAVAAAWASSAGSRVEQGRARVSIAAPIHTMATTYKSLEAFWWNNGSCHGYPDVMQLYEVFRDESGTLVEYRDAGVTAGTDSCQTYHPSTFSDDPDYLDCGGCVIEPDGLTQGNPTGTATGHPQ